MYYVYILRCEDNSLYTGFTVNPQKRFSEHFLGSKSCAKYTKSHPPILIEALWRASAKQDALRLEYHIKRMKKNDKEALIKDNIATLSIIEKLQGIDIERLSKEEITSFLPNS